MKNLTKEEIEELANALKGEECNESNDGTELHFINALKYFKTHTAEFIGKPMDEIFRFFYECGLEIEKPSTEISIEEVLQSIEADEFIDYVKDLIENPKENINVEKKDEFIEIYKECDEFDKCVSYPDYCEGTKCVIKIPASKFDGLIM